MSLQIEKSALLPMSPNADDPEDVGRYLTEISKYLDGFHKYLKKDLTTITENIADHETRITALETP